MYILRYDGQVLDDPRTDTRLPAWKCEMTLDESGSLTLTMPSSHPLHGSIAVMSAAHEVTLEEDGVELFRGRVRSVVTGDTGDDDITCEGQLAYLNDSIVEPYGTYADTSSTPAWSTVVDGAPSALWAWYVQQHNAQVDGTQQFNLGANELDSEPVTRSSTQWPTTGAEVKDKLLDHDMGYLSARYTDGIRYLDMTCGSGRDAAQPIEFGVNLTDYTDDLATDDVITAIVPYCSDSDTTVDLSTIEDGAFGTDYTKSGDRIQSNEGVRLHGVVTERRGYEATTAYGLCNAAAADLSTAYQPIHSLTISAVDLHKVDPAVEPWRVGMWIRVKAAPYHVDQRMMCVSCTLGASASDTRYTLGSTQPDITHANVVSQRGTREQMADSIQAVTALTDDAKATAIEARSTATKAASDVRDAAIVVLSSTRGITFKSNAISTVLQVSVFQPGSPAPIETLAGLQAAYGAAAHIAWWWRKGEADEWSAIVATDSHITHDGFWFSVSADDVDGRTSFRATMDDGKD